MKTKYILILSAGLFLGGTAASLRADDTAKAAPAKVSAATRAELKAKLEELRALPPEERRVKQREFMQSLTPEQRQELRQVREKVSEKAQDNAKKRPEATKTQLEARKKEAAERLAALEKKKADGTLTAEETKQLERMKKNQERLKAAKAKAEKAKPDAPKEPAGASPKP